MTDLHVLLYEPWCPTCGGSSHHGGCLSQVPPLSERMPEAVPAGMDTFRGGWRIYGEGEDDVCCITDEQAVTQYIGNAVEVLVAANSLYLVKSYSADGLTAALHRLADERDAAKETK